MFQQLGSMGKKFNTTAENSNAKKGHFSDYKT